MPSLCILRMTAERGMCILSILMYLVISTPGGGAGVPSPPTASSLKSSDGSTPSACIFILTASFGMCILSIFSYFKVGLTSAPPPPPIAGFGRPGRPITPPPPPERAASIAANGFTGFASAAAAFAGGPPALAASMAASGLTGLASTSAGLASAAAPPPARAASMAARGFTGFASAPPPPPPAPPSPPPCGLPPAAPPASSSAMRSRSFLFSSSNLAALSTASASKVGTLASSSSCLRVTISFSILSNSACSTSTIAGPFAHFLDDCCTSPSSTPLRIAIISLVASLRSDGSSVSHINCQSLCKTHSKSFDWKLSSRSSKSRRLATW
mmetsp:Transcript_43461/g.117944  ORF Transcript_43461/g.117944 Transcript_43461/m.117944 type:complete len:327 (+) Transcript_43461:1418-2398(+)